jgi:hypothetical protein
MKKLFYVLAIAFAASLSFSSCSEEEVVPVVESDTSGGGGSNDKGW